MSKILLREQAIKLRQQGQTYGQIKRALSAPKSTLSDWLRNLPLTDEQEKLLCKNKSLSRDLGREKFIKTFQKKKLTRLTKVFEDQKTWLLPLSEKELFVAGLFLYWGEGSKQHGQVSVSNTDPKVLMFAIYWMMNALEVPKERIKIGLHLYKDMDIEKEIDFWSRTLVIPKTQFNKPYIKKTNREDLTYKGYGHGTCNLRCGTVVLSEKIAMSIKAISNCYGLKNDLFWYN
ncbi:MAG: hypothetical protein Q7R97_00310 [Candidatus Daviesbacteria bacterium]|nr:hypothetical protein [Candidatus Daviesbacteria bacterium]